jgi:peptide chain release factor 1
MKPSMLAKLDQLAERLEELNSLLAQEDATPTWTTSAR